MPSDQKSVRAPGAPGREGGCLRSGWPAGGVPRKNARPSKFRGVVRTVSNFGPLLDCLASMGLGEMARTLVNQPGVGGVAA